MTQEAFVKLVYDYWHAGTCVQCGDLLPEGHGIYDREHGTDWCHACYDDAEGAAEMAAPDDEVPE
jgi:hypothetical protein